MITLRYVYFSNRQEVKEVKKLFTIYISCLKLLTLS